MAGRTGTRKNRCEYEYLYVRLCVNEGDDSNGASNGTEDQECQRTSRPRLPLLPRTHDSSELEPEPFERRMMHNAQRATQTGGDRSSPARRHTWLSHPAHHASCIVHHTSYVTRAHDEQKALSAPLRSGHSAPLGRAAGSSCANPRVRVRIRHSDGRLLYTVNTSNCGAFAFGMPRVCRPSDSDSALHRSEPHGPRQTNGRAPETACVVADDWSDAPACIHVDADEKTLTDGTGRRGAARTAKEPRHEGTTRDDAVSRA